MEPAHVIDRWLARFVTVVLVGGLALTVATWPAAPRPPYLMVDELVAQGLGKHYNEALRVHGWVGLGSVEHRAADEHRFTLQSKGVGMRVRLHSEWPARTKDNTEIVVHGTLTSDSDGWVIEATEMPARCTDGYRDQVTLDTVYR